MTKRLDDPAALQAALEAWLAGTPRPAQPTQPRPTPAPVETPAPRDTEDKDDGDE
jgi:hypothetical protein